MKFSKPVISNTSKFHLAYPFGMVMSGREYTSEEYKFGFNGKEKDNSTFNGYVFFEARVFESRLARWLSKDPKEFKYPWQSTYAYFSNSPIWMIDINGEGGGKDYVVKSGDCLSKIAEKELGSKANQNQIDAYINTLRELNPQTQTRSQKDQINIGETLSLPVYGQNTTPNTTNAESNNLSHINENAFHKFVPEMVGVLSLGSDAVKNLGGLEKAKELLKSNKFETSYDGVLKQWSVKFNGNQSVQASFVAQERANFIAGATQSSNVLKAVSVAGVALNVVGIGFTAKDIADNGWNLENSMDLVMGGVSFVPVGGWTVSSYYFLMKQVPQLSEDQKNERQLLLNKNKQEIKGVGITEKL